MEEINHNKIINQAARTVLKENGLFQNGQSRLWIDDNGWFLILVEFQPSNWEKGSYLNIGINFLWADKDYLSFDYGYREHSCVSFKGDSEGFYNDMLSLAEMAMKKVFQYRQFKDIEFAKKKIIEANGFTSPSTELYNRMMICGLHKDKRATWYYKDLLNLTCNSQLPYEIQFHTELSENMAPIIRNADKLSEYINKKINSQREFWSSKSSMKKLISDNFNYII